MTSYQIDFTVKTTYDHRPLSLDQALRIAEKLTEAIESKTTDGGTGQTNHVVAVRIGESP